MKMENILNGKKQLNGRSCYGHLGGTLGNRIFERFLELGWFEQEEGKATVYKLTSVGIKKLSELGVDINEKR
jgi:hypothetical protein